MRSKGAGAGARVHWGAPAPRLEQFFISLLVLFDAVFLKASECVRLTADMRPPPNFLISHALLFYQSKCKKDIAFVVVSVCLFVDTFRNKI